MAKILVVDDRAPDRLYLTTLLGYAGHATPEAADGLAALDAAILHEPELIITDVLMPGLDGYEFVRRLRALPRIGQTPVIFYTATYHEGEAQALAAQLGVAEVLTKPSEPATVLALVEQVLRRGLPGVSPDRGSVDAPPFEREHARITSEKLLQKVRDLESTEGRLAALISLGHEIASEHNPEALLHRMADTARSVVAADYVGVAVVAPDRQTIDRLVTSGLDPAVTEEMRRTYRIDTRLRRVLDHRETMRGENPDGRPESVGLPSTHPPVYAFLLVPFASATRVHGWFAVVTAHPDHGFSETDETIAAMLGAQGGIAYENIRLFAELNAYAEHLRSDEERTDFAMAVARCGIWQMDLRTRAFKLSRSMADLLGVRSEDVARDPELGYRNIHPDDVPAVRAALERAGDGHADLSIGFRYRMPWHDRTNGHAQHERRGNGTRWYQMIGRVIPDAAGDPHTLVGVTLDLSERHLLEAQLRQAQKMEAIGQLAGGVAHDFNNLLTAILGYSRFLLDTVESPEQQRDLHEIVKAADRAAALTKQLLAFSRRQVIETTLLDLNTLIQDMAGMLRRLIGEHIELTTKFAADLGLIRADRSHIEQVIMNLVVNAGDAMPRGGQIALETQNVDLDETFETTGFTVKPGRYVMVAVSDTGIGMSEETKAHLFEPFYTTKEAGKGTGLGLATVYGIVAQSGGQISVDSEVNSGSTFKVHLPRIEQDLPRPVERPARARVGHGSETVLLVEDEESVRILINTILSRAGYTVIVAAKPAEAREQFAKVEGRVDLLLTDVVMPGGTGPELFAALVASKPDLRVLFMSGYTDTAVFDLAALEREAGFIQKPFSTDKLTAKIRETLDRE